MTGFDHESLPEDLRAVDQRLQAHRTEVSPLELDELKLRTMAKAFDAPASRYGRQYLMRSKLVTLMLVLGLAVSGGAAGVIATHDNGNGKSADSSQYKPGKGCGDKNDQHDREDECNDKPGKPPK
jgi:hypothetical protein